MAVYTSVSDSVLEKWLKHFYDVGNLLDKKPISQGIENTNYFVTTGGQGYPRREFVLTLFEHQESLDDLQYFLGIADHLGANKLPTAKPLADREKKFINKLCDKPATLVERLKGKDINHPSEAHCQQIGTVLAKMHVAVKAFEYTRKNDRGYDWQAATAEKLLESDDYLPAEDEALLKDELAFQNEQQAIYHSLPNGVIHADLFRDNALFDGDQLSGLIDFYYANNFAFTYDLAVTINDWCCLDNGEFDQERLYSLLNAYLAVRPLNTDEKAAWPAILRFAALRFWLSRLDADHSPRDGEDTHVKNPDEFKRKLQLRRALKPNAIVLDGTGGTASTKKTHHELDHLGTGNYAL